MDVCLAVTTKQCFSLLPVPAAAASARSSMWAAAVSIGAVRRIASARTPWASAMGMSTCTTVGAATGFLFVVLQNQSDKLDYLTLTKCFKIRKYLRYILKIRLPPLFFLTLTMRDPKRSRTM